MAMAGILTCAICRGLYKKPKILSCFHSFCETCLESHISRAKPNPKFQCPLCMVEINIPEGGARSLQSNFYIETKAESTEKEKTIILCENCDSDERPEATTYCKVCELKICETCVLLHQKLKTTKSHMLINLVEHARIVNKREQYCSKHGSKAAERYCSNCEQFLCSTCQDHVIHTVEDIDVALDQRKKNVQRTLNESEVYFQIVEERCKVIQDLESLIRDSEAKSMEMLQKRANAMKEEIDSGVKQLSQQIKGMCESELDKLNKKQTMYNLNTAREKHEAVKRWISNAHEDELLKESSRMQMEVMEINASLPSYIPPVSLVMFTDGQALNLNTTSIGTLQFTKPNPNTKQLELLNTFLLPDFRNVVFIASSKENQVWMAEKGVDGLNTYTERGKKTRHILKDLTIGGADFDRDCNLFASVPKGNKIYKITLDYKITTFCTLSDTPGPLAVCPDFSIAVCIAAKKKLLVIDQLGTVITEIQPRYKSFNCIASCKYTNIIGAVDLEQMSLWSGNSEFITHVRSVVNLFDHKGKKIGEFSLKPVTTCIMSNHKGHFLLAHSDGITVIDTKGDQLTKLTCPDYSFAANCLALDALNQLWVAGNKRVFIFKYPEISISATKI